MNKIFIIVLIGIIISCANSNEKIQIPSGWKKPTHQLFNEEWRKSCPTKFFETTGDFNGDKKIDHAYILEPIDKKGFAIFVSLSQANDKYKLYNIYTAEDDQFLDSFMVSYGIRTIGPGEYNLDTSEEGAGPESPKITIKNDAVELFQYDADNYLLEVSRYIHLNPISTKDWLKKSLSEKKDALQNYGAGSFLWSWGLLLLYITFCTIFTFWNKEKGTGK